jgi:acetyltransferase-like isoleucine patch superfamily enzyme
MRAGFNAKQVAALRETMSGWYPTSSLVRALREPRRALRVFRMLARGWWYKVWFPLRGLRLQAGRNLRASGRLCLRGPGCLVLGDNVQIDGVVTPWTYTAEAVISIGSDSYVNGTRFGCAREIVIGCRAILADARILDTDFHSARADRHEPGAPVRVAPVHLEENVWVAAGAGILPGTTIGRNSVVAFGAVCTGAYPADVIIAGNPARPVGPIPGGANATAERKGKKEEAP